MDWTKEQHEIIDSAGDLKINAVAGSGKTTTVTAYAKARLDATKILYLAFNRSVKLEAIKKFADNGLHSVRVETAHSLAYRHVVVNSNYRVNARGYETYKIAELLGLAVKGEKHAEYIVANHINKFITYFCNSDKAKVRDLDYRETVTDTKAKAFVSTFYDYIERQTRLLLGKMDKGEIEITHDFYLKKFQLSNPVLNYDYILFDEGQDASAAMLHVFLKQKATKVIVGDAHQQIYGWRFAINSLEKAMFTPHTLSVSFRFGQDIARLATEILKWKNIINAEARLNITGKGISGEVKTKAVIARTNLGLLLKAIEYVTEEQKIDSLYFEGNINSYTYADEGASLYDVLNLYNNKRRQIKNKLIREMKSLEELEDYIEKTEDTQLAMMVEIVKEYENEIPGIIKALKAKHIENDDKNSAEMIFSTVHRCKGMEYDEVHLVNDFITKEKLEKIVADYGEDNIDRAKLNEEINLLYVAITRAKNCVYIPEALVPEDLPTSKHIHIMKTEEPEEKPGKTTETLISTKNADNKEKSFSIEEVRKKHKDAYAPWTREHDDQLTEMYCAGAKVKDLATYFGRTKGAIYSRIKKLNPEQRRR